MKIGEKIKHILRRKPPNAEKLAARAEAEAARDRATAEATQSAINQTGPYSGY